MKEDTAGFWKGHCLCETVSSTSYDVSGLFWADSFDNSIAVRVSNPSAIRPAFAFVDLPSRRTQVHPIKFIRLHAREGQKGERYAMIDRRLSFWGHDRTYFFHSQLGHCCGTKWTNGCTRIWRRIETMNLDSQSLVIYFEAKFLYFANYFMQK